MHKLISFFLFMLFVNQAQGQVPLHSRIEDFDKLSKMFHQICFDSRGTFLKDKVYSVNGTLIDCARDALTLNKRQEDLALEVERTKTLNQELCEGTDLDPKLQNLADINNTLNGQKVCPGKVEPASECLTQLSCNAFSSVLGAPMVGAEALINVADGYYKQKGLDINRNPVIRDLRKCVKPGTSCITNFLKGVWDSLFTSVKAIWTIVSGAAKMSYNAAGKAYDYVVDSVGSLFSDAEDATTEKMMVAQQLPDSALDKFMADPLGFVKNLAQTMYNETVKSIKEHYGCEQWSGAPYVSKCLVPMANWECGTCNQKANVVCGVLGFIGGEVVTAFFTGGTVAVAKTVGMTAVKGGAVLAGRVGSIAGRIPKVSYVARVVPKTLSRAGRATHLTYLKAISAWDKVTKLKYIAAVSNAAKAVGGRVGSITVAVTSSKPVQMVTGATQLAAKPFTSYLNLITRAFGAGYRRVDESLARGATVAAAPTAARAGATRAPEVIQETSRVTSQEKTLRLLSGHHDPKDLKRIMDATGDKLDDPAKFNYVMDEISGIKIYSDEKKNEILLRVIDDVKNWSPTSTKAKISEIRHERLLLDTKRAEERIRREKPHLSPKSLENQARIDAYAKRARALELKKSCSLNAPTPDSVKAGALYATANLSLTVGSTAVTYALANWNEVKDSEWAKRLGYEVFMSYLISKWGSKIATNRSSTVLGKIGSGYVVNFKTNLIESTAYSTFFSHDSEKARARLEEIASSPHFEEDLKKLDDYVKNRSKVEEYVDATTDAMKNIVAISLGKEANLLTPEDMASLNQDAFKDPVVMEKMMDVVSDQLYSEEIGGNTYGNRFLDRLAFDTEWGLHAVPRSIFVGMITYQAVCQNIDNPAKALAAFGLIQGTNKLGSTYIYYDNKAEEINQ